jgi:hypothetical protein
MEPLFTIPFPLPDPRNTLPLIYERLTFILGFVRGDMISCEQRPELH